MIKKQIFVFILRWAASSLGMYFCITWFGRVSSTEAFFAPWVLYVVAGLIFSLVNSIIKPLVKMLALPLAILTMGISTLIINTAMVVLTIYLLPGVEMDFWGAFLSSTILSLINALMTFLIN
jgi:putative membrane protein